MDWEEYWDHYSIITNTRLIYILKDRRKYIKELKNLKNYLKSNPNSPDRTDILINIQKYEQAISIQNRVIRLGDYFT